MQAIPIWLREKLWIPPRIEDSLRGRGLRRGQGIFFTEHHESHAASAFFPSPFDEAAILTLDGVGEWATTSIGVGEGETLRLIARDRLPPFARPALLGVHLLHRLPGQLAANTS